MRVPENGPRDAMESVLPMRDRFNGDDILEAGGPHEILGETSSWCITQNFKCIYKRMSAGSVISEAMQEVGPDQRVLVAACGPSLLMDAVRDSVECARNNPGCTIDVHLEDFS